MKTANPYLNVEVLGINRLNDSAYNDLVTSERTLAWLQDREDASVWDNWHVGYRDVFILDSQNRLRAVFNLTEHDLSEAGNRAELKQLFLRTAQAVDSDGDGLPDDWELRYFGDLSPKPNEDTDGDGIDNFTEFAFGTNPTDPNSYTSFKPSMVSRGQQSFLSTTFRRRAGAVLDYFIETSPDLVSWSRSTTEIVESLPKIRFDGTGTSEVTGSLKHANDIQPNGFLRVRAVPR